MALRNSFSVTSVTGNMHVSIQRTYSKQSVLLVLLLQLKLDYKSHMARNIQYKVIRTINHIHFSNFSLIR